MSELEPKLFVDLDLLCSAGCGKPFVWTKGEQAFMQDLFDKGKVPSVMTPRRCKECRAIAKAKRDAIL